MKTIDGYVAIDENWGILNNYTCNFIHESNTCFLSVHNDLCFLHLLNCISI